MKLWILAVILLGRLTLAEWANLPQAKFLQRVAQEFCFQTDCKKARVGAIVVGEEVFIFAECLPDELEV